VPHKPKDIGKDVDQVSDPHGEIYIEYKQVGQAMKVIAVDAATGTEVVIMGPASAAQSHLQKVAIRKLKMQLKKAESEGEAEDSEEGAKPDPKGWTA
jgi:hypothetical protein